MEGCTADLCLTSSLYLTSPALRGRTNARTVGAESSGCDGTRINACSPRETWSAPQLPRNSRVMLAGFVEKVNVISSSNTFPSTDLSVDGCSCSTAWARSLTVYSVAGAKGFCSPIQPDIVMAPPPVPPQVMRSVRSPRHLKFNVPGACGSMLRCALSRSSSTSTTPEIMAALNLIEMSITGACCGPVGVVPITRNGSVSAGCKRSSGIASCSRTSAEGSSPAAVSASNSCRRLLNSSPASAAWPAKEDGAAGINASDLCTSSNGSGSTAAGCCTAAEPLPVIAWICGERWKGVAASAQKPRRSIWRGGLPALPQLIARGRAN